MLRYHTEQSVGSNAVQSKNGGAWLALHFAEKLGRHGILSVVSQCTTKSSWKALTINRAYILV